ncbi:MAG TPA: hypothetical protein VLH60_01680, partial [Sedimentisphaerales bacterium]|nr:hypothetical protein [Sedimentisphaerales bacterium]
TEKFLELAGPAYRHAFDDVLGRAGGPAGWAAAQQGFLKMVDDYVEKELLKPVEAHIGKHEAGGQWRIGFPHLAVRGDNRIAERMAATMSARKKFTDASYFHGFPDCQEVHHEIETFLYFQMPLSYLAIPGSAMALDSLEDVAHHTGNWVKESPAWYDWRKHGFVSTWLGTRSVRDFRPYDYQEANHWRHTDNTMAAYLGTGKARYLELILDYAARWCEHIERLASAAKPIRCSILPPEIADAAEGYGRYKDLDLKDYKVFYSTVAMNTAYDVAGGLLDLYRVTGEKRYLRAMELMLDQFFENGDGSWPASGYSNGQWVITRPRKDGESFRWSIGAYGLARLAMRRDMVTGQNMYSKRLCDWADLVDESRYEEHQMTADVLLAKHYYTGDASALARAYAMALRVAAVCEANDEYHQCNSQGRQGSKNSMTYLYQPLLGGCERGMRGNIPILRLQHIANGVERVPDGVSFRTWRIDATTDGFEAVNTGGAAASWILKGHAPDRSLLKIEAGGAELAGGRLHLAGGKAVSGRLIWSAEIGRIRPRD